MQKNTHTISFPHSDNMTKCGVVLCYLVGIYLLIIKRKVDCFNTKFHLPTLLHVGYSVNLKKHFKKKTQIPNQDFLFIA